MTLYARIASLLVAFVAVSVLALSWFSYLARVDDFLQQRAAAAETLTAAIAKTVIADTLEERHAKVRNSLRAVAKSNAELRYILLFGFDGQPFASTYPDAVPAELQQLAQHGAASRYRRLRLEGRDVDDFSHPLIENLDARIHVGYDTSAFAASLRAAREKTLWLTLGVIALALLAAALAAGRIGRPLRQLAAAVRDYGRGQAFAPESIARAGPEVAVLVDSFATMVKDRQQAEQDLRIAATAFEAQEAIVITDVESRIVRVNKAFTHITGYAAADVVGQRPSLFKSGRHDAEFYRRMWATLLSEGSWSGEIWDRRRSGESYPKWLTITAVKSADGKTTHYVGSFIDITAQKTAEEHILRLAYHDALTNLPNRISLHERMQQVIALARRDRTRFALLLIDLDRFKQINDTLGHHVGDELLIEVGRRLTESVRDSDIVARLGGDEFVVVLNAQESQDSATRAAETIVAVLSTPFAIAKHELRTSPSIGICLFPDDADELDELIKHADVAMYQAKAQGRGRYCFFTPQMQVAVSSRMVIEQELRVALAEGQFELHYQPQLDLRTGRIFGVEALVRWRHPQRGLVSPADFIPIAEEIGIIDGIGDWVIDEACRQMQAWRQRGLGELSLSINLSAGQFLDKHLPERIRNTARAAGIPTASIDLEVTETMAMASPNETIAVLHGLRREGISLSIDDFGTGYSSLAYLKLLPFNTLKIDRAFVKDIETDPDDAGICDVTVLLAHKLGRETIAEGVETEGQLKFLLSIGCEKIQGYLISKPLPAAAAEAFIRANPRMEGLGTVDLWKGSRRCGRKKGRNPCVIRYSGLIWSCLDFVLVMRRIEQPRHNRTNE
ncbi:MAG: EAL domain-containing protein [Rhodocyclales bacterium]|nr:EAL domain-containing protein [Rhodocyclales bacterium]